MDTIELETFRQQLLQMQNDLRNTLTNDEQGRTVELDQSRMGRLSRMDAQQNQQVALEQKRRMEVSLQAIAGALRRIENGSYGYCYICEEPLSQKRLAFDPTLTRCVNCMDK